MTTHEIESTLNNLYYTLKKREYDAVVYGNEIRVRIGRKLLAWVRGYCETIILNINDDKQNKTIFGYQIEVDDRNPMKLEILVIEKVFVVEDEENADIVEIR